MVPTSTGKLAIAGAKGSEMNMAPNFIRTSAIAEAAEDAEAIGIGSPTLIS